jgi:tight adherence protein C
MATRVGRIVRRLGGRRPDVAHDRRLGRALLAGLALAPAVPVAAPVVAMALWAWPTVVARRQARARVAGVVSALPDVVDLFVVAIGSGLNVPLAIAVVAPRAPPPLLDPLVAAAAAIGRGERVADALSGVPEHTGDAVRPLITALVTSLRYGAPLLPALERVAAEVRLDRRRRAEEAARRVPVKLLFPLVLCTLPAFALLSVAPVLVATLRDLRL